jgi:hypothetical protein
MPKQAGPAAGGDAQIRPRGAPLGLAQRPRRQAAAVAVPAGAVLHQDLATAPQPIVLESVVGDDDVAAVLAHQGTGNGDAVRAHRHRHAAVRRQQHGLVAEQRRVAVRRDQSHGRAHGRSSRAAAAVAPRRNAGPQATLAEMARQPAHQRRLARAADAEIADHDHRRAHREARKPATPIQRRPQRRNAAVGPAERRQRGGGEPCRGAIAVPDVLRRHAPTPAPAATSSAGSGSGSGTTSWARCKRA